jgi:hypothetical protein
LAPDRPRPPADPLTAAGHGLEVLDLGELGWFELVSRPPREEGGSEEIDVMILSLAREVGMRLG